MQPPITWNERAIAPVRALPLQSHDAPLAEVDLVRSGIAKMFVAIGKDRRRSTRTSRPAWCGVRSQSLASSASAAGASRKLLLAAVLRIAGIEQLANLGRLVQPQHGRRSLQKPEVLVGGARGHALARGALQVSQLWLATIILTGRIDSAVLLPVLTCCLT